MRVLLEGVCKSVTDVTSRNRSNRRKGAQWETDLREGLRAAGEDVESLRLAGSEDEGDLVVRENGGTFLVIEAKNAKVTPGPFLDEAARERVNFAKHRGLAPESVDSIVIVKRRGKSWRKALVLTTVEDFFGLDPE
jgi:Holliday junction resolvase